MTSPDDPQLGPDGDGLQPLPETREAINELEPTGEPDHLLVDLLDLGQEVRELVPECVGLSLATVAYGVTLTLVASDQDIAVLDAVQYLDDGPCVSAVLEGQLVAYDVADRDPWPAVEWEERWRLFAEATSAAGVRSTLTLPIVVDGDVVGSVNLYAASPRAFEGLHDQIAAPFLAWAPGAVRNADLTFSTREQARRAPGILRSAARVDAAVGLLLRTFDLGELEARRRLHDAALRAGVEDVLVAQTILDLLGPDAPPART